MGQCISPGRGRTCKKKKIGDPNLGLMGQNWTQNFCYFLKVASLVFLDIARDCSLEQCVTSSRAETSQKIFCGPIWVQSDLFYSNVSEHPLKLACSLLSY